MKAMKYLGLTLMLGACTSPQPKDYYEIVGEVKNVEDSTIINLTRWNGDTGKTIAIDTIIGGKFYFKIKPDSLAKDELSIACQRGKFPPLAARLWASADDLVKVTGENTLIYTWKVEGNAPEIASSQAYINDSRKLWDEYQRAEIYKFDIYKEAEKLPEDQIRPFLKEKFDSLKQVERTRIIQIKANEIRRMKESGVDAIWLENLSRLAAAVKYEDYPYKEEAIALYNGLTEEQKQTERAQEAYIMLFPPQHVEVGKEMADADLFDLQGNKHHLAELKGKYILIDFWSTGCSPCIAAIPEMGELASIYKDKLHIVSISTDKKKTWEEASQKHPITWHNWNDLKGETGIYASYDQRAIPNYTLISPEGIVLKQWTGYGKGSLKKKIEELLNKK